MLQLCDLKLVWCLHAGLIVKKVVTAQDVSRELLYSAEAQLSDQLT